MKVKQTTAIDMNHEPMNHSTCDLRFLELEAEGYKKYDELLKTVERHALQLKEIKSKLVRIICD